MDLNKNSSSVNFIDWLNSVIEQINNFENKGREAVANGSQKEYMAIMRNKAELLSGLSNEGQAYLNEVVPANVKNYAAAKLEAFSQSASRSLQVGSVFFMSALLFPEDHKAGAPNDLERFRDELKKMMSD